MDNTQTQVTKLYDILSCFKKNCAVSVLLLGAYGSKNIGDLAILDAMIKDLDNDKQIVYTIASNDLFLRRRFKSRMVNPFSLLGFLRALKQDVIVVGGGGLFGHETHKNMKLMVLFLLVVKLFLSRKIVFYNIGIYGAEKKIILRLLWFLLRRADVLIFRNDSDTDIIPNDILQTAKVEPDITFSLDAVEPCDKRIVNLLKSPKEILGLSLRFVNLNNPYNTHDKCVAAAVMQVIIEEFLQRKSHVLFMPFQPQDLSYVEHYFADIIKEYKADFTILGTERYTVNEIKWIIGQTDLAVGMRLHFQIFAHDLQVPIVGISYASKNTNFLARVRAPTVDAYSITANHLRNAVITARQGVKN